MASKRRPRNRPTYPWMTIAPPRTRSLQVYALDPSSGNYCDNRVTLRVPWEELEPGPAGAKVAVIDYDAANGCYYTPVDLDDPHLLARHGLDPSESDPRFHQQMVYAVACRTIDMFEIALGRDVHWRRAERYEDPDSPQAAMYKRGDIRVLRLYPHAMQEANAYYSPAAKGIVFGYFSADETNPGRNLPGQRIFTCLSHDIIAHEMTHAIIDGIRTHFTEPTNPDVLAFHEGFADLCALFAHFSLPDLLVDTIRRTGGRLYDADLAGLPPSAADAPVISAEMTRVNPLTQLALQFGQARGGKGGLRSAIGVPPTADDINRRVNDAHFRGSILVSAVFDAFFGVYLARAEGVFEIHRDAGGRRTHDLPLQLAQALAEIAAQTATLFFNLCARSLDYCPPVDITFGDFLRALITVAQDTDPDDHDGVRDSLMEAFRVRGIFPEGAGFFSEDALAWQRVPPGSLPALENVAIIDPVSGVEGPAALIFGGTKGLTSAEKDINGRVLRAWVGENRAALGLHRDHPIAVPSFHSVFRQGRDGRTSSEMIVEVVQSTEVAVAPGVTRGGTLPFRGGATLVIDGPELGKDARGRTIALAPQVRLVIGKGLTEGRLARQRSFAAAQGLGFGTPEGYQANFQQLHEGR